jgi:hypothetical protein
MHTLISSFRSKSLAIGMLLTVSVSPLSAELSGSWEIVGKAISIEFEKLRKTGFVGGRTPTDSLEEEGDFKISLSTFGGFPKNPIPIANEKLFSELKCEDLLCEAQNRLLSFYVTGLKGSAAAAVFHFLKGFSPSLACVEGCAFLSGLHRRGSPVRPGRSFFARLPAVGCSIRFSHCFSMSTLKSRSLSEVDFSRFVYQRVPRLSSAFGTAFPRFHSSLPKFSAD